MAKKASDGRKKKCPYCAPKRRAVAPGAPRKRKKRHAVVTEYEWRMGELLRIKEEFLNRNPDYIVDLKALVDELPENGRQWTDEHRERFGKFVLKWDLGRVDHALLRREPYGSGSWVWHEGFGVMELSSPDSDLLVIGIDVRHDAKEIAKWVEDAVLDVRLLRRNRGEDEARWRLLRGLEMRGKKTKSSKTTDALSEPNRSAVWVERKITDFMKECHEALRAWDLHKQDMPDTQIRDELYPDAGDFPADDPRSEWVDDEKRPDSALKKTRRRLALARHLIEHEGYREILPLTGWRSQCDTVEQWLLSSGLTRNVGRSEGGGGCV